MTDKSPPDPPDPLDVFLRRPTSELLSFVYEQQGAKGLRQLLAMALDRTPPDFSREQLQEEVADLRHMRLPKVASIVEEFIDRFPSELDTRFYDWGDEPTAGVLEHWRGYRRRIVERRRKRRGLLARDGNLLGAIS